MIIEAKIIEANETNNESLELLKIIIAKNIIKLSYIYIIKYVI